MPSVLSGFAEARGGYHERIPLRFGFYALNLAITWQRAGPKPVVSSLLTTLRRYGPNFYLLASVGRLFLLHAYRRARRLVCLARISTTMAISSRLLNGAAGSVARYLGRLTGLRAIRQSTFDALRSGEEQLRSRQRPAVGKSERARNGIERLPLSLQGPMKVQPFASRRTMGSRARPLPLREQSQGDLFPLCPMSTQASFVSRSWTLERNLYRSKTTSTRLC